MWLPAASSFSVFLQLGSYNGHKRSVGYMCLGQNVLFTFLRETEIHNKVDVISVVGYLLKEEILYMCIQQLKTSFKNGALL